VAAGMRAIRVFTGEYASLPGGPEPWANARNVVDAIGLVRSLRGAPA